MVNWRGSLIAFGAALALSGCGGSSAPPAAPAATAPASAIPPTASLPPRATPQPEVQATKPALIAAANAIATTARPTAAAQASRVASSYKGIEQGITADGFPYLGRADAPLTLSDYSDFL